MVYRRTWLGGVGECMSWVGEWVGWVVVGGWWMVDGRMIVISAVTLLTVFFWCIPVPLASLFCPLMPQRTTINTSWSYNVGTYQV